MVNTVTYCCEVEDFDTEGFNTKSASHTNRPTTVFITKETLVENKSVNVCERFSLLQAE